jgi:hypothetical protein
MGLERTQTVGVAPVAESLFGPQERDFLELQGHASSNLTATGG